MKAKLTSMFSLKLAEEYQQTKTSKLRIPMYDTKKQG